MIAGKRKTLTTYLLLTCHSYRKGSLLHFYSLYAFPFNFIEIEYIPERRRRINMNRKLWATMN